MSSIEIGEKIASGDTGSVYRGTDGASPVAVKILHEHLASDPIVRARFLREGETLTTLRHPHIVSVFDVAEVDSRPALVMELLSGGDLRGTILGSLKALELLQALADALSEIHRRGIVHRDLRPEHILFDEEGSPRIIDFGMASVKDLSGLTRSTVYSARPGYQDPYTWGRGRPLPTQDIYGLGCLMHTVITGKAPSGTVFSPASSADLELRRSLLQEKADSPLAEIVNAMIDEPERRPRSAAEILEWIAEKAPPGARRFIECLHCGKPMPEVAPLCLSCGLAPLRVHIDPGGEFIALRKITEKQDVLQPFLHKLRILSAEPLGEIKLIIGDARMYSRAEQKAGTRLPVRVAENLHTDSVGPIMDALAGSAGSDIRLTRHPMARRDRVKRGPLIRMEEHVALPATTVGAIGTLVERESGSRDGLHSQCRYSVSIAAARLASDPSTRHLAEADHIAPLWGQFDAASRSLEATFELLAGTDLQSAYADLERLEIESHEPGNVSRAEERDRIVALFEKHGDTERLAADLEQRIVQACRVLETIEPATAVAQLTTVEALLSLPARRPGNSANA